MKAFFLSHKKLHLWLLTDLVLLEAFLLLRPVRPAMEALSGAMANQMYVGRFDTEAEMNAFYHDLAEHF